MKMPRLSPPQAVILAISALSLASLACSAIARSTPAMPGKSSTATRLPLPTPPALTQAKPGHWEGTPSLSFDIAANGDIRDFKMTASIGTGTCTIEVEEIPAQADGSFTYTALVKEDAYWPGADRASLRAKNVWPTPVVTEKGPMVEYIRIGGTIDTPTALSGTFKILICGDTQILPAEGKGVETWSATWKSATPTGSPTKSAQPPAQTVVVVTRAPQPLPSATKFEPLADTPAATELPATSVPEETPSPAGSWQPLPDLPRQINTLVADPGNSSILYAGTGNYGSGGGGVYKSEDAGLTWRLMVNGLPKDVVKSLAFSHAAPFKLYAVVGPDGDIYATTDGAENWEKAGVNTEVCCNFGRQFFVSPVDSQRLFMISIGGGGDASYSRDGGQNWTLMRDAQGPLGARSLALDPANPDILYLGTEGYGVYKSSDEGQTWAAANRGMLDYHITALAVDPGAPQTVYAGGNEGELFKTTDGGQTWTDMTKHLPFDEYVPGTLTHLAVQPGTPGSVVALIDRAGLLVSRDGAATWQVLGKPGEVESPQFTAMAILFEPQLIVLVGANDKGGWRYSTARSMQDAPGAAQPSLTAAAKQAASTDNLATATPTPAPAAPQPTLTSTPPTRAAAHPQPTPVPAPPPAACPDPRAAITSPANGATIQGIVPFIGTASLDNLVYYKFEYKPADAPTWQFLTQVDGKAVAGDKLMDFYTTTIAPGIYDFRLLVVDRTGNYPPPCEIRVTVQR